MTSTKPLNSQKVPSIQSGPGIPRLRKNEISGTRIIPSPSDSSIIPTSAQTIAMPNSARRAGDSREVNAMKNSRHRMKSRRCQGSPRKILGSMPRAK